jgi:uncharacterized RDD family membrane protein YckC
MGSDDRDFGRTDLIDVGELPTDFDEDQTEGKGPEREVYQPPSEPRAAGGLLIAELKDRFAAFFIDVALLYFLYWMILIPYRSIAFGSAAGPIPASGKSGLIFHGIVLLIAFLWFSLQQFVFSATVGKMFCHLTVRKVDGSPITFTASILRTVFIPIDIILSPLLVSLAAMEWSAWHRRIGDIVASTLVIKKLGRPTRQYALSLDIVSSATRRAIAFVIDLGFALAFTAGYALMLTPDQPMASMVLLVLFPPILLAFFMIPEWLTGTSPGKWVLGMAICHEDGTAIGVSTALVRNLWRIFDANPLGYLTSLFSVRKQRPGDTAAGSLVVTVAREWKGLIGLVGVLLISTAVLYAGSQNRTNFLKSDFEINFLPSFDISTRNKDLSKALMRNLGIRNFNFAAGSANAERKPAIFSPGETLYMIFDVGGFAIKDGSAWIQEDLNIRYPDGSVGLKLQNINDFNQELTDPGLIRFENNIQLPEGSASGRYTVTITLRDRLARSEIKEQRFFYITPPDQMAPQIKELGAPGEEAGSVEKSE